MIASTCFRAVVVGMFAGSALAQCNYRAVVLNDSPVAYWRLGETSNSTALDETGAHHGRYLGSGMAGQINGAIVGEFNLCIRLTGDGSHIVVPNAPSLNFVGTPFTIEAWVKRSVSFGRCTTTCIRRIVDKSHAGEPGGYGLEMNDIGIRTLGTVNAGGTLGFPFTTAVDTWYHVVTVSNGAGSATTYVNGVAIGSGPYESTIPWTTDLRIGVPDSVASSSLSRFVGYMDEVAIYAHALSGQQIANHYYTGINVLAVISQPGSSSACAGGTAGFTAAGAGVGVMTQQWQMETRPLGSGLWSNLVDGPLPAGGGAMVTGAQSTSLQAVSLAPMAPIRFRCIFSSACGTVVVSAPATMYVNSSDFNNDSDFGTDADIEAFFACLGGACCGACGSADFNGDGDFGTDQDIEAFFRVLAGGAC